MYLFVWMDGAWGKKELGNFLFMCFFTVKLFFFNNCLTYDRWQSDRPGGSRRSRAEFPAGSTTPAPSSPSRSGRRTDERSSVEPSPPVRAVGGGDIQQLLQGGNQCGSKF